MPRYPGVSTSVMRRLPRYYRFLGEFMRTGVERISSREFAEIIGLTASQIRQDLSHFGGFGQQGYGYNVSSLHAEIGHILGLDQKQPIILIGAGNLGMAILNYMNFQSMGFELIGIFDRDPRVLGRIAQNQPILHSDGLSEFCRQHRPAAAILCIPRSAAVEIAPILVERGVRAFWNFSHYDLSLDFRDKMVSVENVHLGDSLMTLSFRLNNMLEDISDPVS